MLFWVRNNGCWFQAHPGTKRKPWRAYSVQHKPCRCFSIFLLNLYAGVKPLEQKEWVLKYFCHCVWMGYESSMCRGAQSRTLVSRARSSLAYCPRVGDRFRAAFLLFIWKWAEAEWEQEAQSSAQSQVTGTGEEVPRIAKQSLCRWRRLLQFVLNRVL